MEENEETYDVHTADGQTYPMAGPQPSTSASPSGIFENVNNQPGARDPFNEGIRLLWGPIAPPEDSYMSGEGKLISCVIPNFSGEMGNTARLATAVRRLYAGQQSGEDWKEFQAAWNDAGNFPRLLVDGVVRGNVLRAIEHYQHSHFAGEDTMPNSPYGGYEEGNQGVFSNYGMGPGILLPVELDDGGSTAAQTYPIQDDETQVAFNGEGFGYQEGNEGVFSNYGNSPAILLPVPLDGGGSTAAQTYPIQDDETAVASMNGECDMTSTEQLYRRR